MKIKQHPQRRTLAEVKTTISMCQSVPRLLYDLKRNRSISSKFKKKLYSTYLCLNAQSSPMNNERLFGKLIKTVLPLTGKLPECSFCYKQYTAAGEKPTLKTKALISSDIILSVYPFFASVHRTFTKIMVDHKKTALMKLKELKSYKVCSQITMKLN